MSIAMTTEESVTINEDDFAFNLNRFKEAIETPIQRDYDSLWRDKMTRGLFRYQFDRSKIPTKTIRCEGQKDIFNYVVQLNIDRSLKKREAQEIVDIRQPFDENRFNFTKIPEREFMFKVKLSDDAVNEEESFVAINVSPMELGNCLIIPDLKAKLPQILTEKSLKLAVNIMLCIHSVNFRIGFNGLLAYASVNHLHLHSYYLDYNMALETNRVEHLAGNCYIIADFPAKGFAFQIRNTDEIRDVVRSVLTLTDFLLNQSMAHNVFITRGLSFDKSSQESRISGERDCLRIYVWTRRPTAGIKSRMGLHPALCELFGHFLIKDEATFEQADALWISNLLTDLTNDYFTEVNSRVRRLFSEMPPKDTS